MVTSKDLNGAEAESNQVQRSEWQRPTLAPAPHQENSNGTRPQIKTRKKEILLCALEAGRLALPC